MDSPNRNTAQSWGGDTVTASNTETRQTPAQTRKTQASTRKRLLLEILDALTELNDHGFDGQDSEKSANLAQDAYEKLPTGERYRIKGANQFYTFRKHVNDLDQELQNLSQSFRQFGSAGVISSSFQLRTRLAKVLFIFNLNASTQFSPNVRVEYPPETITAWKLKSEPAELEHLADDLLTFLKYLHEFPDLTHEPLKNNILRFRGALKQWAISLRDFQGQFRDPVVEQYVHELSLGMNAHLARITMSIRSFVEGVVPDIRVAQQQAATTLVSLSGLAAFISAVTATGIQITSEKTDGALATAVNAFWFSSLVFSVASAVYSLLGFAWTQSRYRSPRHRVPWWISIWIKRGPFIFLLVALVAFSVGLVLFTWESQQHIITCLLTTIFTGGSLFGLLAVSIWFAFERSTFIRHKGQRLLADVIADRYARWTNYIFRRSGVGKQLRSWGSRIFQGSSAFFQAGWSAWRSLAVSKPEPSVYASDKRLPINSTSVSIPPVDQTSITVPPRLHKWPAGDPGSLLPRLPFTGDVSVWPERAKTSEAGLLKELHPRNSSANTYQSPVSSLNRMEITDMFPAHRGMVSHLQFSSDGKWLATSGRDRMGVLILFKFGDEGHLTPLRTLRYPSAIRQITWEPNGRNLLIRLDFSIKVWTEDSDCADTIERPQFIQSIAWLPNGLTFLSLERSQDGSEVNEIDLGGRVLTVHHLPQLCVHDVVITPDAQYMLCVATMLGSPDNVSPHPAREETQIIVYNIANKGVESQIRSSHILQSIKISRSGEFALVNRGKSPTQLWRLEKVSGIMCLSPHRTYISRVDCHTASPSDFGGREDQLVIRAGQYGRVHIWDRKSAIPLHDLHEPDDSIACVAWNPASPSPIVATGTLDGSISLWTVLCDRPIIEPSRSVSKVSEYRQSAKDEVD